MKTAIIFLALFHSIFLIDQDSVTQKHNIHSQTLCIGEDMILGEGQSIKFKKVISDSRCPRGEAITCIWAGEVKILVEFYENGKLKGEKIITGSNTSINRNEVVAGTAISIADFFNVEGLKISSVAVYPYPEAGYKISPEEYSLNLEISEKVETD